MLACGLAAGAKSPKSILNVQVNTVEGKPIVVLTFHIDLPGGKRRVQTVTTARILVMAARAITGKYPQLME